MNMKWKVGDIGIYTFKDGDEFYFRVALIEGTRAVIEWIKCKEGFNWEGQQDPIDINVSNVRFAESTLVSKLLEEYD
jgi:hypothetical protein